MAEPPVYVLGMHRSGTSLFMGLLHGCGLNLGENLMPTTAANPKGSSSFSSSFPGSRRLDPGGQPVNRYYPLRSARDPEITQISVPPRREQLLKLSCRTQPSELKAKRLRRASTGRVSAYRFFVNKL